MTKQLNTRAVEFFHLLQNSRFTSAANHAIPTTTAEEAAIRMLLNTALYGANVFIVGNRGNSAVSNQIITDLRNIAHLSAIPLHQSSVLACFANDGGYEQSFVMQLEKIARPHDVLIAISNSGQAENIINSAMFMKRISARVITLTGFEANNPLRMLGDINYWVDSSDNGYVEIAHLFLLHHWADCLATKLANDRSKNSASDIRCTG